MQFVCLSYLHIKHGISRLASGDFAEQLKAMMAISRYGKDEEIASFVAYLAGPEAGYITGASPRLGASPGNSSSPPGASTEPAMRGARGTATAGSV